MPDTPGFVVGAELEARLRAAAVVGLEEVGHVILETAKHEIPVGDPAVDPDPNVSLRDSGHVEVERAGRSVVIVFDTPYAAKQHEQQRYAHPRGGHAKFLERPLMAMLPRIEGILASEVRKRFSASRGRRG
jgi:hypothetical protein